MQKNPLLDKLNNEKEANGLYANRITYTLPTRISNWYEDLLIGFERDNHIALKETLCRLSIQQVYKILNNLFHPVVPSCQTSFVAYGENYQLQACKLPTPLTNVAGYATLKRMCLSGLMNEHNLNSEGVFTHGCHLTASQLMSPCRRNVFVFEDSTDRNSTGPLLFGKPFYIRIHESGSLVPLYVQFETNTFDDFGEQPRLKLTQSCDCYCLFKIKHWFPSVRREREGTPVELDTQLIIQHVSSGQNLTVEYQQWVSTFFGNECVVSCRTVLDIHRFEGAENMWVVLGKPNVHMDMYVRAARGEEIPEEMIN